MKISTVIVLLLIISMTIIPSLGTSYAENKQSKLKSKDTKKSTWRIDPNNLLDDPNVPTIVKEKLQKALKEAIDDGNLRPRIGEAYRTPEKSEELYQKYQKDHKNRAAPAWQSAHNYGLGFDIYLINEKGSAIIDANIEHEKYETLSNYLKKEGFEWGEMPTKGNGIKNDAGHFEYHPSKNTLIDSKITKIRDNAITESGASIEDESKWLPYFWKELGVVQDTIEIENLFNSKKEKDRQFNYLFSKGQKLSTGGIYSDAVQYYERALKVDPNNELALNSMGDALFNIGFALELSGQTKEAMQYYEKSLDANSNNVVALLRMGYTLDSQDKPDESIKYYEKILDLEPSNTYALINIGFALVSLGQYEEAIKYFKRDLQIEPNRAYTYVSIADALESLGQHKEAIKYYDKAIKMDPDNKQGAGSLASQYKKLINDKLNQASDSKKAETKVEVNKEKFNELFNKAISFGKNGQYDEAIEYYKKALEIDPNDKDTLYYIGLALFLLDKDEEAIKYFNRALEIEPDNAKILSFIGAALYKLDRNEEAIKYYKKSLKIEPDNADTLYHIGRSLYNLGQYEEAIKYFNKALEIEPNHVNTLNDMGDALRKIGQHNEAIKYYKKSLKIEPDNVNALSFIAAILTDLGQYKESVTYYDRLLEIDPNDQFAQKYKKIVSGKLNQASDSKKVETKIKQESKKIEKKVKQETQKKPQTASDLLAIIDSASCTVSGHDDFGFTIYAFQASGTMTGPVSTSISVSDRDFGSTDSGAPEAIRCSDWPVIGAGYFCSRSTSDLPSTTKWSTYAVTNFKSGKTVEFVASRSSDGFVYATSTATCPTVAENINK